MTDIPALPGFPVTLLGGKGFLRGGSTEYSMTGFPVLHSLPEFVQAHIHCVGDAIQPFHSLSLPSPPALSLSQYQGLFY